MRSGFVKGLVAILCLGIIAAGVCCMGFASRDENGKWFSNSDLKTWHWTDKSDDNPQTGGDNSGDDNGDNGGVASPEPNEGSDDETPVPGGENGDNSGDDNGDNGGAASPEPNEGSDDETPVPGGDDGDLPIGDLAANVTYTENGFNTADITDLRFEWSAPKSV